MKRMVSMKHSFGLSLLLVPVIFLPGCFQTGETEAPAALDETSVDQSEVVVTLAGKPKVSMQKLNEEYEQYLEENPQYKQVLPFFPDFKRQFLEGMVVSIISDEWARRNEIANTADYQKDLKNIIERVKRILNTKFFHDKHAADVTEAEVKKYYEEMKDKIPNLIISQGGVNTEGVSFEKEEDAQAFLTELKESKKSLEQLAKEKGMIDNYRDFKLVNNQSIGIDPALSAQIIALTTLPTQQVLKAGEQFWAIDASGKEEPKYRSFDESKEQFTQMLKKQKSAEVLEKAVAQYKKEYDVQINDEPLKSKPEQEAQQDSPMVQAPVDKEVTVAQAEQEEHKTTPVQQASTKSV